MFWESRELNLVFIMQPPWAGRHWLIVPLNAKYTCEHSYLKRPCWTGRTPFKELSLGRLTPP